MPIVRLHYSKISTVRRPCKTVGRRLATVECPVVGLQGESAVLDRGVVAEKVMHFWRSRRDMIQEEMC